MNQLSITLTALPKFLIIMITNTILLTNLYDALDGPISSNGNNEYFQGILSRDLIKQTLYVLENLLTHFKGVVFGEFFSLQDT